MDQKHPDGNEQVMMQQLRDILLRSDRQQMDEIKQVLNTPELLSEKIDPLILRQLDDFKERFPAEFEHTINGIIEQKIKDSQEEILNVVYPVLGKMIRKYIVHQFQQLKDSIDARFKQAFTVKGYWTRMRSRFFGIKDSEIILSEVSSYTIEEIYVVQYGSGLLMGKASTGETIDQDVIAGMLTAIKAFVEDAFKKESQELEMVEYGNYKIFLQNFYSYYIAVIISGTLSSSERAALSARLIDFAETELSDHLQLDEQNFSHISGRLTHKFIMLPVSIGS